MIGQTLGHYRIIEKIGAGGMGAVYRAHDDHLDREVAVKVLAVNTLTDKAARDRFHKEALALSKLSHPNVATIFDFDTEQDVDFLAMELILGSPLSCMLAAGPLDEAGVLKLGMQTRRRVGGGSRAWSPSSGSQAGESDCDARWAPQDSRLWSCYAAQTSRRNRADAHEQRNASLFRHAALYGSRTIARSAGR